MSALPIDVPLVEVPGNRRRRWVPVESDRRPLPQRPAGAPVARPRGVRTPGGRPAGVAAPQLRTAPAQVGVDTTLHLTRRGLAVVVGGFAALMLTALVVLVVSFLSVSNEPILAAIPLG